MLHIENLDLLDKHVSYMQHKLGTANVFLVGGCIRDILLGITTAPDDLDVTLAGQPKQIASAIDTSAISFFMTEKYGTMTIIPREEGEREEEREEEGEGEEKKEKKEKEKEKKREKKKQIQYEITPFRTESGYSDARHPDQITWTNNIVLDAQRRDFTINAMYYTLIRSEKFDAIQSTETDRYDDSTQHISLDIGPIQKLLEKIGMVIIQDYHTIFVSNEQLVETFFPAGKFDEEAFVAFASKEFPMIDTDALTSGPWRFVIDPTGGLPDMLQRKLKAVGDADKRIEEDALRIIRALRFVNVLNDKLQKKSEKTFVTSAYFDFEKATWKAVKKNYYKIQHVAKERIKTELDKVFRNGNPAGFIGLLDETNLLKYLFPALHATKGVNQPVRYHPFDVYVHSLLCLKELQEINGDYIAKYAMLYHDVGKTEQYYSYEMGLTQEEVRQVFGTWLNHIRCGADMVEKDFRALGFSKKEIDSLRRYVANHMKIGEIVMAKKANWKKKIRKLISEAGEEKVLNLIDITIADRLGQQNPIQPPAIEDLIEIEYLVEEIMDEEGQFVLKHLAVNGNDIINMVGIPAGPAVGEILKKAFDWVIDDITTRNKKEVILAWIKEQEKK